MHQILILEAIGSDSDICVRPQEFGWVRSVMEGISKWHQRAPCLSSSVTIVAQRVLTGNFP